MPIYNSVGGITGLTIENDPSALKLANNLSDLPNKAAARTSLQLMSYYAPVTHSHAITDVTNLQTTLDGKAASSHTHPVSDVTGWGSLSGASNGYVLSWNGSALVWVAQSGGGGGISDAPSDGSLYARQNAAWASFTIPTVPPASVTNIDLTGNFNGYSMGSGYYSFKYDSTANTMRMENGSGGGTSVGAYGIQENVTSVGTSLTLGATDGRILHVQSAFYTISIPSDATYSFPIGTRFFICSPAGSTVTAFMSSASLNGAVGGNHTLLDGVSTLIKVAADTWFIK